MPPAMEPKRGANFGEAGPQTKKTKTAKMNFAQRMMEKMGHVQGQGLGKAGEGMINPIAVKLRPQGAGVGSVKEKTPQQKAEEKRAAEQRGEHYEDSSEEERKERRRKKEGIKQRSGQPMSSVPGVTKTKVRTVAQIETEEGLQVPDVFKSFIDYTGATPRQITSTAELPTTSTQNLFSNQPSKSDQLVRNARVELEAFAGAWHELQDRKRYCDIQEADIRTETANAASDATQLQELSSIAARLSALEVGATDLSQQVERIAEQFNLLKGVKQIEVFHDDVTDLVTSFIDPLVVRSFDEWTPLEHTPTILPYLKRIKDLLLPSQIASLEDTAGQLDDTFSYATSKHLDAFESIMFTRWLPKIRTAVTNWAPYEADVMLSLLLDWRGLIPVFLLDIFVNQLVAPKLIEALKSWKPSGTPKSPSLPPPHRWLFPWLEHASKYHMDPRSSSGLIAEVKRKFRSILGAWNLNKGPIGELDYWLGVEALQHDLNQELQLKILPRLAQFLREELEIDPSDQDRTPIDVVLKWEKYFSPSKFARVFVDAFFPKWFSILHVWLTSDPNYEEVGQWYEWWHGVFSDELNQDPSMRSLWDKGLEMMTQAMELGPENVKEQLIDPSSFVADQRRVENGDKKASTNTEAPKPPIDEEATMKDILDELCEQDDLLLLPLRKAHPETGHPLLRITASASGGGGVVVYIAGDVVMAQNKRDRNLWEPLDVYAEGILPQLAASR